MQALPGADTRLSLIQLLVWGAPWLQHLCRALDATMGGFLEIFSDSLSRTNRMMDGYTSQNEGRNLNNQKRALE